MTRVLLIAALLAATFPVAAQACPIGEKPTRVCANPPPGSPQAATNKCKKWTMVCAAVPHAQ